MRFTASLLGLLATLALAVAYCHATALVPLAPVDGAVRVDFYVMSKCPDAQFCENVYGDAINRLLPIIDLHVEYIGRQLVPNNITCPHGPSECVGDMQQLCAQLLANPLSGTSQWWNFTTCQSATRTLIPDNGADCAAKVGLDYGAVNACVSSVGPNLLWYSAQRSVAAKQGVSCTVSLNQQPWCVHDSTWKNCTEGTDAPSLIAAVCKRYRGTQKAEVCQGLMADSEAPLQWMKRLMNK